MKARIVGTNDVFTYVEKVVINGVTYMPEVLEFEVDDNYDYVYTSSNVVDWGKVRIKAAIAAMQGLISNENYSSYTAKKVREESENPTDIFIKTISQDAVEFADALIKELKGE